MMSAEGEESWLMKEGAWCFFKNRLMLTGKAKEDFRVWLGEPVAFQNFDNIPELVKHAYLVKWFDHVGLIIEIGIHQRLADCNMWRGKINNNLFDDLEYKISREEAINVSITKANEIYNKCDASI